MVYFVITGNRSVDAEVVVASYDSNHTQCLLTDCQLQTFGAKDWINDRFNNVFRFPVECYSILLDFLKSKSLQFEDMTTVDIVYCSNLRCFNAAITNPTMPVCQEHEKVIEPVEDVAVIRVDSDDDDFDYRNGVVAYALFD